MKKCSSALSEELQDQLSAVMNALEATQPQHQQLQHLGEVAADTQYLTQEAVNAFDAELVSENTLVGARLMAPARGDVGVEEALDRLEEEVQRRSGWRVGRWSRRRDTLSFMAVVFLAGAFVWCCTYAEHLESADICSSSTLEVAIVFLFMPAGYVLFSCLGLGLGGSLPPR